MELITLNSYDEPWHFLLQDAAERTPLFEKRINSKSKEIRQMVSISGKHTGCRFISMCFEQIITQVAALNIDKLM